MKIYLDDVRAPYDSSWILARSFKEFVSLIKNSKEQIVAISFDHDLGQNEPTGYDAAKWLVEQAMDNPSLVENLSGIIVHSDNTPGRENIATYFESAKAHGIFSDNAIITRAPAMLNTRRATNKKEK